MKLRIASLFVALLILGMPMAGLGQEPSLLELEGRIEELQQRLESFEKSAEKLAEPQTFRAYWKDGLYFESMDKQFKMQVGGRMQNDWVWWNDDNPSEVETFLEEPLEDGTEFRRARLFVLGQIYERLKFKAEYDFAGGDGDFNDVYMELTNLGFLGSLRAGHFKEPFSLEQQTSSKYFTFMERALPNALVPGRDVGFMLRNQPLDKRMTWAIGLFRGADSYGIGTSSGSGEYNVTLRVTGLPWYQNKGRELLHLGIGYSHRSPSEDTLRFRQSPEVHLSPRFVDTGNIAADAEDRLGAEAAFIYGPFSLQGEWMFANVDALEMEDPTFYGYYMQVSYLLTGENRKYSTSSGAFGRLRPKRNFIPGKSWPGAWEVAFRFSNLDLDDEQVTGGELDNFTFGVNWYLNPNARVMWNYVLADLEGVDNVQAFTMRLMMDF